MRTDFVHPQCQERTLEWGKCPPSTQATAVFGFSFVDVCAFVVIVVAVVVVMVFVVEVVATTGTARTVFVGKQRAQLDWEEPHTERKAKRPAPQQKWVFLKNGTGCSFPVDPSKKGRRLLKTPGSESCVTGVFPWLLCILPSLAHAWQ